MLEELTSRHDLELAAKDTGKYLDTVYFHFSLKGFLKDSFPESPIRLFVYPPEGPTKYYFMIKDNVFIKPTCVLSHVPGTKFDRTEFMDCLREFRVRALGALDSNRPHLLIAKEELVKVYSSLMRNIVCEVTNCDLNLFLFYMDKEQKKNTLEQSPELPNGYCFEDINPLKEGELINSTWKHAKEGDLEQTIAKLVRLPSSCVKFDGVPVAFEMVDPAGYFNNQYVFEAHRRKGLGTAVEIELAQKCIRRGMTPFKTVDQRNTVALNLSCASANWTQWTNEEGLPEKIIFQEWTTSA